MRRTSTVLGTMVLALPSSTLAKQQLPISGCGGAISCSTPRGFGTLLGTATAPIVLSGPNRFAPAPEVRLILPPLPGAKDYGAVDAAIALVKARNPELREALQMAQLRVKPAAPKTIERRGSEIYLRISKPDPVPTTHRLDVPSDAFAAMPLRTVPYPQFQPRNPR